MDEKTTRVPGEAFQWGGVHFVFSVQGGSTLLF